MGKKSQLSLFNLNFFISKLLVEGIYPAVEVDRKSIRRWKIPT